MFFILSKTVGFFTYPSNALIALGCLGVALALTRWRRFAIGLMSTSFVVLLLLSVSPIGNVLMLSLTERFPAWQSNGRVPDGIIILGGAIDSDLSAVRPSIELGNGGERVIAMLDLARQYPQARLVFSGGSGNLLPDSPPEAPYAQQLMTMFGQRADRLLIEDQSRTTYENAVYTKALVQPKPGELWLLVTSASHMPRSIGVFRKVGFDVVAYPVDWRVEPGKAALQPFNRASLGLSMVDTALHEWIGMIAYWLTGKTSALLPAP